MPSDMASGASLRGWGGRERARAWLGWIALLGLGGGLCVWLWGRVGDVLGDFGQELYLAWQLSRGRILYRDLAYQVGPLSPYFNAAWMRLMGPGPAAVLLANLLVLILSTTLLYRLMCAVSSPRGAWLGAMYFLPVFALSSITRITNFNYLAPYAHGVTHGLLLCLGMILCLGQFHRTGRQGWAAAAGFACGLALLTKPEIFLAGLATCVLGLGGILWLRGRRSAIGALACAAGGALAGPTLAFVIFAMFMPAKFALSGVLKTLDFIDRPNVIAMPFYQGARGTDDISASLVQMARSLGWDLCVIAPVAGAAWAVGRRPRLGAAVGLCAGVVLYLLVRQVDRADRMFWADADRPLLLFAAAAVVISGWRLAKSAARADENRRVLQWSFSVLSLALLAKIFLNVRTYHYGFVLAAPVAMLTVLALVEWIPAEIQRRGGCGRAMRWAMIGLLAGLAVNRIVQTQTVLAERTLSVPLIWGGSFKTSPADADTVAVIKWLSRSPPAMTVIVLPVQGGGVNYAAGLVNPSPYCDVTPLSLVLFGEQNILRAFQATPPNVFVILNWNAVAFGATYFGQDYGVKLERWIGLNYRIVTPLGAAGASNSCVIWMRK